MDPRTADFYNTHADELFELYGQVEPSYFDILDRVFATTRDILDVGCGTGRDSAYLLKRGKNVFGMDASAAMLAKARQTFEQAGLDATDRLIEASLPDLSSFDDASFDGVLCNAVLMHLPEELLFDTAYGFKRILRPGGTLLFILPETRPGIDSKSSRDCGGRLYTGLPAAKLQLLLERIGFRLESSETIADPMERPGYTWNRSVLKCLDDGASRPLQLVESILNRDNKVATYKLALFRALAEIAQTQHHLASFQTNGKVSLAVRALAEKWMLYYWPLFHQEPDRCIRQGTSGGPSDVAIRGPLTALVEHYQAAGGMEAFYVDWKGNRLSDAAQKLTNAALSKLSSTIWNMPARHSGGGDFEVFQYDSPTRSLRMDTSLWRELCLMGSWIQDATVLRWAELTEQINKGAIKTSQVVECLLTVPNAARNVADARKYFEALPERTCVWTERKLSQAFAVDHAMPFALWRNNDLWNLFPTANTVNQSKSDRLPSYDLLNRRRDGIIQYWQGLHDALGERFSREAQTLLGRDQFIPKNWERPLFTRFVEAFETTANLRGSSRWDPRIGASTKSKSKRTLNPKRPPYPETEEKIYGFENALPKEARLDELTEPQTPILVPFHEVGEGAYRTHLPVVASLAAGDAFHGFETGDLAHAEDLDWIAVPNSLIRSRRFVVRVAGDSMEPTLLKGNYAVFEYHRSPRRDGEIVIANLPAFGPATDGTEAIKRIRQSPTLWIFESDNPNYELFSVSKEELSHPILGCYVDVIGHS